MQFGEKLRMLRKNNHMTQAEVAGSLGITSRTLINYELGKCLPKQTEILSRIATLFDVSLDYLMCDESAGESESMPYDGQGMEEEVQRFLNQATGLFSGGKMSENDRDFVMRAITELYWETRTQGRQNGEKTDRHAP